MQDDDTVAFQLVKQHDVTLHLKLNSVAIVSWTFDVADVTSRTYTYLREISFKGNIRGAAELS